MDTCVRVYFYVLHAIFGMNPKKKLATDQYIYFFAFAFLQPHNKHNKYISNNINIASFIDISALFMYEKHIQYTYTDRDRQR